MYVGYSPPRGSQRNARSAISDRRRRPSEVTSKPTSRPARAAPAGRPRGARRAAARAAASASSRRRRGADQREERAREAEQRQVDRLRSRRTSPRRSGRTATRDASAAKQTAPSTTSTISAQWRAARHVERGAEGDDDRRLQREHEDLRPEERAEVHRGRQRRAPHALQHAALAPDVSVIARPANVVSRSPCRACPARRSPRTACRRRPRGGRAGRRRAGPAGGT